MYVCVCVCTRVCACVDVDMCVYASAVCACVDVDVCVCVWKYLVCVEKFYILKLMKTATVFHIMIPSYAILHHLVHSVCLGV